MHKKIKHLMIYSMVLLLVVQSMSPLGAFRMTAKADSVYQADLRMIFTTDIHGQLTTEDYENEGVAYDSGGLSRAATLIKNARSEVDPSNSLLFDLGDSLYDYTTDYIYNYDSSAIQPIYTAMAKLGYDAVTLGNHDFDYTLKYIKNQLTSSGLSDKVVLSNVTDANTGAHVWAENRIIEKTLVTKDGNAITAKIGLIGETVPGLSKKRTSYKGVLQTEDIVENVKKQTAKLKEQGADVVVVLAHSGVGEENPEPMANNTGYALTKIEGVDAVLCGHKHFDFPIEGSDKYDGLSGYDKTTGLVNGKPLVQIANRASGIGIADVELSFENDKFTITSSKTQIRKVQADTEIDQEINGCMGEWSKTFMSDCSQILADIDADSAELNNYFGIQEDTDVIQLMNNIKISYGLSYVNNIDTTYQNYPIVGASSYIKYGSGDGDAYIDIRDEFKKSNMYDLINYKTGLYLYKMTGAQIKEWLEWSASCYETADTNKIYSKNDLPKENYLDYDFAVPVQYALQEKYLEDWSNFYVFDGIEYTIDTRQQPRYSAEGEIINDTNRITSLKRNGKEITDKNAFVVVTHRLPDNALFNTMGAVKLDSTSTEKYRNYVQSYIERISYTGSIQSIKDNNWNVEYSNGKYLLQSGGKSKDVADKKSWIKKSAGNSNGYDYYIAEFTKQEQDTTGPGLNIVNLSGDDTCQKATIVLQATDSSGVASIKYVYQKYGINNSIWNTADEVKDNRFVCSENGVYSVLATDTLGNKTLQYIRVLNTSTDVLSTPVVEKYTNRKKYIQGTAEPKATIYFKIKDGATYSTKVGSNGTFKYKLPVQEAGKKIYVYVINSAGKTSARNVVTVQRTGPNIPSLDAIKSCDRKITGTLNDTYTYPIVLVNNSIIYVQDSNVRALYEKSAFYAKGYKVVTGNITVNSSGKFTLTLPKALKSSVTVALKTVDSISRCSLQVSQNVVQSVPPTPIPDTITNASKTVKLYTEERSKKATVVISGKKYYATKAEYVSSKDMYCFKVTIPQTDSTVRIKAYLTNEKGNSKAVYVKPVAVVPDRPVLSKIKAGQKVITGKVTIVGDAKGEDAASGESAVKRTGTKVYVYVNKKKYQASVKDDGTFQVKVKKLKKKDIIVCKAKNKKGNSASVTVSVK